METSTYHWENFSGSWQSSEANPCISVGEAGYASDKFYLSVQYAPPQGGFSGGRVTVIVLAQIIITGTVTPIACYGQSTGAITLNVTGGSPLYTYLWSDGVTTKNRTGLNAGTYSVTVTDSKGCRNINLSASTFTVTQPSAPLSITSTSTDLTCFGVCDGAVTTNVSGGTSPYTYIWSNGSTQGSIFDVCNAIYSVTVTDYNHCTLIHTDTVNTAAQLAVTGTADSATCFNTATGSVNISVTGGTTPYVYLWSNGAFTEDLENVYSNSYSVTITDSKGCQTSESFMVNQPSLLYPYISGQDVSCFGGSDGVLNSNVNGGTAPYTYIWSNGSTTQNINGLSAGTYYATVTDNNNCQSTNGATLQQQTEIVIFGTITDDTSIPCNGRVFTYAIGGVAPYTYLWSNGSTTANIENLCAGDYYLTVTDNNNCIKEKTFTVNSLSPILLTATVTDVTTYNGSNGSINLSVSGGTAPYTYLWSNGATTQDISGLISGEYSVTVTDNVTQTAVGGWFVNQIVQPLIIDQIITSGGTCMDSCSYTLQVIVSGGVQPYTYSWSNDENTQTIDSLCAWDYSVTVTDATLTSVTQTLSLEPSSNFDVTSTQSNLRCHLQGSGAIHLQPDCPQNRYTYLWSTGATTRAITGLSSGAYSVTVTNQNNISVVKSYTIE